MVSIGTHFCYTHPTLTFLVNWLRCWCVCGALAPIGIKADGRHIVLRFLKNLLFVTTTKKSYYISVIPNFKNLKETVLLSSLVYCAAFFLSLFSGVGGLSPLVLLLPLATIVVTGLLFFCVVSMFVKKQFNFFPKTKIVLYFSALISVVLIFFQIYNPIIMQIAQTTSDVEMCEKFIRVDLFNGDFSIPPGKWLRNANVSDIPGIYVPWSYVGRNSCIEKIAIKTKDVSLCNLFEKPGLNSVCVTYTSWIIAKKTGDVSVCENILKMGYGSQNTAVQSKYESCINGVGLGVELK